MLTPACGFFLPQTPSCPTLAARPRIRLADTAVLKEHWEYVYGGVTPENSVFPLEPAIRNASKGEANGTKAAGKPTEKRTKKTIAH